MPSISTPKPIHYVALGDSLANGVGAEKAGYPQQLRTLMMEKQPTHFKLYAISGQTSSQLLKRWPTYTKDIAQANIITWNIGGNDLRLTWKIYGATKLPNALKRKKMEVAVTKLANHWNILARKLRETAPANTTIIALNLYNPYQKHFPITDQYIKKANQVLEMICQNHNIVLIDAYTLFNIGDKKQKLEDFLAPDNLHLNAEGYHLVASQIYDIIYPKSMWQTIKGLFQK
jgi:lysophospholipase L1-like esterase